MRGILAFWSASAGMGAVSEIINGAEVARLPDPAIFAPQPLEPTAISSQTGNYVLSSYLCIIPAMRAEGEYCWWAGC
jgi:hypothetical protein